MNIVIFLNYSRWEWTSRFLLKSFLETHHTGWELTSLPPRMHTVMVFFQISRSFIIHYHAFSSIIIQYTRPNAFKVSCFQTQLTHASPMYGISAVATTLLICMHQWNISNAKESLFHKVLIVILGWFLEAFDFIDCLLVDTQGHDQSTTDS